MDSKYRVTGYFAAALRPLSSGSRSLRSNSHLPNTHRYQLTVASCIRCKNSHHRQNVLDALLSSKISFRLIRAHVSEPCHNEQVQAYRCVTSAGRLSPGARRITRNT
jgi:hypothetical protein